ncbi:MAG: hypothetical protein Q8N02_10580 [Methylotenera sp.]|nr:hypothetical protein [Methylotenera sp.]MDP2404343.1 hypothetical protein [Methylotenera sp.]MDP3096006.1 hypothetical protein [Methylotenera sp.]MDZ4223690.1 hypothetical protein [Methylotenera sp.]
MKLNRQDWQKMQTPLVLLGVVFVMVTLLIGFAQHYNTEQEQALQTQQNLLNAARQRYQSSGTEKDMITEFLPQYQALINQGFVGEERRIEWVDNLRAQHKNHQLFGIKYNISQQEKYTPAFAPNLGGFVLHRSIMKLELDMLHEGDLLQLTESLNANNAASFMLRDCEIVRLNTNGLPSDQLIANLHAQCELDWLTLREPAPIQTAVQ